MINTLLADVSPLSH